MSRIRLTRLFTFEAAHALQNYQGGCRNIHGHSYRLEVTIIGTPIVDESHPNDGMVMDFKNLKKIVQEALIDPIDHALLLRQDAPQELVEALRQLDHKLVLTPFQPTCENMLIDFKQRLGHLLPEEVALHSLKLWETEKSFAEWYATDNA
ncbi:6-carboxytetrahydropterin synthase [Pontibacter sp. HSC-14F20]|uniref:6-pyruvoyl trahydropterin synthase family protein n=1 Tax=Pontibacter sp. HSC-14F20 TaxID=2864136 RepID=UPI001C734769|nr:6-carboxytetrahydropterin synthase [Pontibacter sp. HSC-14F20]MBX0332308.1 6-carboxytetrahydropterin synthase [Pontibacter sp. HSC-14F20]